MDKSHEKAQLDRIEEKMDRILHLLESGDLSASVLFDEKKVAKNNYDFILNDHLKQTYTLSDVFLLKNTKSVENL